jgi:hypothetical protein
MEEYLPLIPELPVIQLSADFATADSSWFHQLSGGVLETTELAALRMV